MVMDGYYSHDRKPELWAKINSLHLSYLEMTESPKKLEDKNKLDECIKKFLCIAPHTQKFCFKETAEVLHRSASSKKDFSGYRAALGWNAIGMYAGNLIAQPWRQEYREIKMYSGFYKHQIEANLVGAEIMFEVMGYKHAGNGILILEGPVCPDTVQYVSQDSLVAYVECQILKEIWEEVSASYKISWLEVLEFRETHLCSSRKSIEALKYQIQQRQFQEQQRAYSQGNSDYITNNSRYSTYLHHVTSPTLNPTHSHHVTSPTLNPTHSHHVTSPTLNPTHSFPPLTAHAHLPMPIQPPMILPPQCVYNNGLYSNYGTYNVVPSVCNFPPNSAIYGHIMKQPYNSGFYCNGYIPQSCGMSVPTGQLIEIEPPQRTNYDINDGVIKSQAANYNSDENYNKNIVDIKVNSPPKIYDKDDVTGTFENWDYVYRNLESQGYSKDLGERGDVLSVNRRESKAKEHELKVSDKPMKINEALEKLTVCDKMNNSVERKVSNEALSSSYENLSTQDLVKRVTSNVKNKSSNPPGQKNDDSDAHVRQISKMQDSRKIKTNQSKNTPAMEKVIKSVEVSKSKENAAKENLREWECASCTYLNDGSKTICDICSKSRIVINQEMEVGGSECSQCTLVNPKNSKECVACGSTLQNSPTYI